MLYGNITFDEAAQEYIVHHSSSDGWSVTSTIKVQTHPGGLHKNYTIAYFVFEKVAKCSQYPPNNNVTFYNISIEWDGKQLPPAWSTGIKDDACNNRGTLFIASPHSLFRPLISFQPTSWTNRRCKSLGRLLLRSYRLPDTCDENKIKGCGLRAEKLGRSCACESVVVK